MAPVVSKIAARRTTSVRMRVGGKTIAISLLGVISLSDQTLLTTVDGLDNDHAGNAVDVDGDYLAVGVSDDDIQIDANLFVDMGSVYMFHFTASTWNYEFKIFNTVLHASSDSFGTSVSLGGDYVAIGSPNSNDGGNGNEGKVFVYLRDGFDWNEHATFTNSVGAANDKMGTCTSFDNSVDIAVGGAPFSDIAGTNAGGVIIFDTFGETEMASIYPTSSAGAQCGYSVSLVYPYLAIGCPYHNSEQGFVSVYMYDTTDDGWNGIATLDASIGAYQANFDLFGYSVAINTQYLIVGAPNQDTPESNRGGAYVYAISSSVVSFVDMAENVATDAEDEFGISVNLFDNIFIVGAPSYGTGGSAFSFSTDGFTVTANDQLSHPEGENAVEFGISVACDDTYGYVGATYDDVGAVVNAGSVTISPLVSCEAGEYVSGTACLPCEYGKYQPLAGEEFCIDCGAGRYNANQGSINENDCNNCSPGSYNDQSASEVCQVCVSGKYAEDAASESCIDCVEGKYNPDEESEVETDCILCSTGKYNNYKGSSEETDCRDCPRGQHNNQLGQIFCLLCVRGKYNDLYGQVDCTDCEAGKFATYEYATACHDCLAGKYSTVVGSLTQLDCVNCGPGKYSTILGADSSETCEDCTTGKYNGKYGSNSAAACLSCPSGTYQDQEGSSKCVKCQMGKYVATIGNTACTNCAAGKYGKNLGLKSCTNCPVGKLTPTDGMSACTQCPANTYNTMTGQSACTACPSGMISKAGSSSFSACACPTGYSRFDNACFKKTKATTVWDAINSCGSGAHLAQFSSRTTQNAVATNLCGTTRCWVGAYRNQQMDLYIGGGPMDGDQVDAGLIGMTATEGHYYVVYGANGLRGETGGSKLMGICLKEDEE